MNKYVLNLPVTKLAPFETMAYSIKKDGNSQETLPKITQ